MLARLRLCGFSDQAARVALRRLRGPRIGIAACRAMSSSSEEAKAKAASTVGSSYEPTIFDKIVAREIPADIVYEDSTSLAFRDIAPQAPCHILVIPKTRGRLSKLSESTEDDEPILGHLMHVASKVAKQEKLDDGFRIVVNNGVHGCQSVYHIHLHVLGGRQLKWPPG